MSDRILTREERYKLFLQVVTSNAERVSKSLIMAAEADDFAHANFDRTDEETRTAAVALVAEQLQKQSFDFLKHFTNKVK